MKGLFFLIMCLAGIIAVGGIVVILGHGYDNESDRNMFLAMTAVSLLFCFGSYSIYHHLSKVSASAKTEQSSSDHYCLIGHKIIKSQVKSQNGGLYYTDKVDPNIRYFIDDSHKVTAIKYMYEPNHKPGHSAVIDKRQAS